MHNVQELIEKRNLLKKSKEEEKKFIPISEALDLAHNTICGTNDLPFVKITQDCTIIELLERIVVTLKSEESALSDVKVKLKKSVGQVVEPIQNGNGKEERDPLWITTDYWKDNIQVISDYCPSGGKIAVAIPKHWNHKAILLAHGYRNEINPELINDLPIDESCLSEMLKDNWIVAMTSYRRNGRVVRDAMEDMVELRQYILTNFGFLTTCLLEGRSMGGAVVTYLSENYAHLFNGAVAIGAALDVIGDNEDKITFNFQPEFPILYLTNQSELGKVEAYIDKVKKNAETQGSLKEKDIVVPALWEVWREGHNMVSQVERLSAWKSLISWVEHGTFITARKQNLYLSSMENLNVAKPIPVLGKNGKIMKMKGVVLNIHPVWKTFYINFTQDTMAETGVKQGKIYQLTIVRTGTTFDVLYTTFPFLCARDTWISFDHPDNVLVLEQFTYDYRDHAGIAGVVIGDVIEIAPKL